MWANVKALRAKVEAMCAYVKAPWRSRRVHGLELFFDTGLLVLRIVSISYWLRSFLPPPGGPGTRRDNAVDLYCVSQLVVLLGLLWASFPTVVDSIITGYILFEIYLNLFNIVFIGKLGTDEAPPASIERSILLLFLNGLQVTLGFGIVYRDWLHLSPLEGFFNSVLVMGTIGFPNAASGWYQLFVVGQVFLDLALVVFFFSTFAGEATRLRSAREGRSTSSNGGAEPTD